MFRGYRLFIAALAGIVLCGAQDERDKAPSSKPSSTDGKTEAHSATVSANNGITNSQANKQRDGEQRRTSKDSQEKTDDSPWRWTDIVVAGSAFASAIFAGMLAWLTWRLIVVGRNQHQASMQAIELARDEFNATHRPEIVIHSLQFITIPAGDGSDRVAFGAAFVCFNSGNNGAKRVEVWGELVADWNPPLDGEYRPIEKFNNISAGVRIPFAIISQKTLHEMAPRNDSPPIHCVGRVIYWDNADARRETGFSYRLQRENEPFWTRSDGRHRLNYAY